MSDKEYSTIKFDYWCTTIIALVLMVVFHFVNDFKGSYNQTISSIAILSMLIGIPFALKFFHVKTEEKVPSDKTPSYLYDYLRRHFSYRFRIIVVAMLLNFVAYEVLSYTTAIYCLAICLIVLIMFCRPNRNDLESLLSDMIKKSNPLCE